MNLIFITFVFNAISSDLSVSPRSSASSSSDLSDFESSDDVYALWKAGYNGWYKATVDERTETGYKVTFDDYASWGSIEVPEDDVYCKRVFTAGDYVEAQWCDDDDEYYAGKVDGLTNDQDYFVTFDDYSQWGSCQIEWFRVKRNRNAVPNPAEVPVPN